MIIGVDASVDTTRMEDANLGDLRSELAALEAEEARVSAERRHLHQQIDFGYASESTRAREREVSDHRRDLHSRIDALRERLDLPVGAQRTTADPEQLLGDRPIGELQRIGDGARDDDVIEGHDYLA
jgi:uncharacterized protein involved in exopolysaccharide biosynthesis